MFQKYKEEIKFALGTLLVLAVVYAVCQYGQSVRKSYNTRTFTVEGSAKVATPNDIGSFTATVRTEGGTDTQTLQSENSEKMNAVLEYLKSQGIAEDDLETQTYTLLPKYSSQGCRLGQACPPAQITGYTVDQSVVVTVRDVDQAGALLSGVVTAGANTVSQLSFRTDDNTAAVDAARIEALQDAQKRAQAIAQEGHFRKGKLVTFYETGQPINEPYPLSGVGMADEKSAVPTVQPGTTNGEVTVVVTYEIR